MAAHAGQPIIRLATDCSGLEAPYQALLALLPAERITHVFSSEISAEARTQLRAIAQPTTLYHDLTLRDHAKAPGSDIYVAGFPCQPFSRAGRGGGFADERGNVFAHVASYIELHGPSPPRPLIIHYY